jgi:hypothetical protein
MDEKSAYSRGLRLDKQIRFARDNIFGHIPSGEYNPVPPPIADFFLLLDGTNFLLLDGTDFLLLS